MKHNLESSQTKIPLKQKQELLASYKNLYKKDQQITHGIPSNKANLHVTMADILQEGQDQQNTKQQNQNWLTETHQSYQTFKKEGSLLYPENFNQNTIEKYQKQLNQKAPQEIYEPEPFDSKQLYANEIPEITSIYKQFYTHCHINDEHELRKNILQNQQQNDKFQGKHTTHTKYNAAKFQGFELLEIARKNSHKKTEELLNNHQQEQLQQEQSTQEQQPYQDETLQDQENNNVVVEEEQQEPQQYYQYQEQQNEEIQQDIQELQNEIQIQNQENSEALQRRQQRIKKFNNETRDLPDSAFLTYYGKPPFANYGNQNVTNKLDGFLYGNYMQSYNVNPHRNVTQQNTQFQQTQSHALDQCEQKYLTVVKPQIPRKFIEKDIPIKYPNYLKSEGQEKQSYKQLKKQKEELKKKQEQEEKLKLEEQNKQKDLLQQKRGQVYLEKHLDLTRTEDHIQKKITQQQQIDQEKFIQKQLEQRLEQLEFEQDPDQSFIDNLQEKVASKQDIGFNIVVTKPDEDIETEKQQIKKQLMESSINNNLMNSSKKNNSNQNIMMQSKQMNQSSQNRKMSQSKQNQQLNESKLKVDRRQSTTINKNKTKLKIGDKSSFNQTRQLSFKLKVEKDPEDNLNKAQKVFSRFNATKSTLEQDKKILQRCKQIKDKQINQQIQIENSIKKFDPAKFHKYVTPDELNPKKYPHTSEVWIERMPPAGKRQERNDYIYNVIQSDF